MLLNLLLLLIFLPIVAEKKSAHIPPILEYYESTDVPSLTRKIRSIPAFKGIGSPVTADGYIDYTSRYVQSDVNIALSCISNLAHKHDVLCSAADSIIAGF